MYLGDVDSFPEIVNIEVLNFSEVKDCACPDHSEAMGEEKNAKEKEQRES